MLTVAWVTSGFVAPGVQARSGRPLELLHEFGGGTVAVGIATSATAAVAVGPPSVGSDPARGTEVPQPIAKTATTITPAALCRGAHPFNAHPSHREGYSALLAFRAPRDRRTRSRHPALEAELGDPSEGYDRVRGRIRRLRDPDLLLIRRLRPGRVVVCVAVAAVDRPSERGHGAHLRPRPQTHRSDGPCRIRR